MKAIQQIKAVIIARGEVQRVGYGDIVERAARKMKLTGIVENIKPYDVKIICEGNKTSIDSFIKLIDIKEPTIEVEELEVSFEDATGEFDYFEIKRGDMAEELGERLDIANINMTLMMAKQDSMIEKLDDNTSVLKENTSILKDFKSETNRNFTQLTNIMTKHDVDAQERIAALTVEVSDIKTRLA
jgi:acylphosphatase